MSTFFSIRQKSMGGAGWTQLKFEPKAKATFDPVSKRVDITLDSSQKDGDAPQRAAWLTYAMGQVAANKEQLTKTAFQRELMAWQMTLSTLKTARDKGDVIGDVSLQNMQRMAEGQSLEIAVFLLTFKESYRTEFEAWKKAHPNGVREFIEKFSQPALVVSP